MMKVKITLKSEDLKEVMDALGGKEDYSTITKVIEIDQNKQNVEYLVKSGKILDWDFEGGVKGDSEPKAVFPTKERKPEVQIIPEVRYEPRKLGPGPNNPPRYDNLPLPDISNLVSEGLDSKITPVSRPKRKAAPESWNITKSNIAKTLMALYPDGLTSDDIYGLLEVISNLDDARYDWNSTTLTDIIVPKLAGVEISEADPVTVAILNYLDVMYGHQSSAEIAESFAESVRKSWEKRNTLKGGIRPYFEYTFATKLAGI